MISPLISHHQVARPSTLDEALHFLSEHAGEGWQPLAGGTDLVVGINHRLESRSLWLDLWKLRHELAQVKELNGRARIGAMVSMTQLRQSSLLSRLCPLIAEAAATVGAAQIQNRATVAGNIMNASPAGDTLPVWLALDAELELSSSRGVRVVPYADFATGYRQTLREPDELLTAVLVSPLPGEGWRGLFRKVGTRAAQAISKVVLAGLVRLDERGRFDHVRLAFGSMNPVTVRASSAEQSALGKAPSQELAQTAAALLEQQLSPIDDVRSTAAYRLSVARNITAAFLAGHLGSPLQPWSR